MKLAIVIVNYRTPELVIKNLSALSEERKLFDDFNVIVIDNGSKDRSVEQIDQAIKQKQWKKWVFLEPFETNTGFASGNNRAIISSQRKKWSPSYFFLLNPDASVKKGTLFKLVDFMDSHPNAGIVGPRILNTKNEIQASAFRFPTVFSELIDTSCFGFLRTQFKKYCVVMPFLKKEQQVDWISGAAMCIRSEMIENSSLMDDYYFLYYEEVDLCFQAKKSGWEIWHLPTCNIEHQEGAATQFKASKEERRPAYWFYSRARFFEKNHGIFYRYLADTSWISGYGLCLLRRWLKKEPQTPRLLRDFLSHWKPKIHLKNDSLFFNTRLKHSIRRNQTKLQTSRNS